jgi:5-methyltetrahydropteroyltriglutamate--homocysteine methyltransferase
MTIRRSDGTEELAPPVMRVVDKVRHLKDIQVADFQYLRSLTRRTPKVTIPSPTMLHFRGGRAGISKEHYPDLEPFYQDVADAYGAELRSLAAAGCTYVQMDDTNLAYLCVIRRCRTRPGSAATTRASCRIAMRRSSTASSRRSPPA